MWIENFLHYSKCMRANEVKSNLGFDLNTRKPMYIPSELGIRFECALELGALCITFGEFPCSLLSCFFFVCILHMSSDRSLTTFYNVWTHSNTLVFECVLAVNKWCEAMVYAHIRWGGSIFSTFSVNYVNWCSTNAHTGTMSNLSLLADRFRIVENKRCMRLLYMLKCKSCCSPV